MKRVLRSSINAAHRIRDGERTFTAREITELLSEIEQLKDCHIDVRKSTDGTVKFVIDNVTYEPIDGK